MAARIVVTRPRSPSRRSTCCARRGDARRALAGRRPLPSTELHAAIAGADAVVTLLHDRVDDAFLDAAGPQLRVVANVAVGYDNIDVRRLRARAACSSRTRPAC